MTDKPEVVFSDYIKSLSDLDDFYERAKKSLATDGESLYMRAVIWRSVSE